MKRALIIALVTIIFADAIYRYVELPWAARGRAFLNWLDEGRKPRAGRRKGADQVVDPPKETLTPPVRASR